MAANTQEIKIDPTFKRLIQPLEKKALAALRDDLINDSSARIIQVWNGYVLHEHEKYVLCQSLNLPVQIDDKSFLNHEHAASYLCNKQLSRKDLTSEYRKYLIGELFYFEEKRLLKESPDHANAKYRIAYKIGAQLNIVGGTVLKYNLYATAMNTIFDQNADFALRILLGQTRVSHENVIELSRLSQEELRTVAFVAIKENIPHLTFADIRLEARGAYTHKQAPVSRRERREQKAKAHAAIHQIPAYDPDSEVNSLCMTITSWVSSVERVNRNTDFRSISNRAMLELMKQLTILEGSINTIQKSLVERTTK